jgi:hypothetical protein
MGKIEKISDSLYILKYKVIKGFFWTYLIVASGIWIYFVYSTIRSAQYSVLLIVYIVNAFFGLLALYSYVNNVKVGNKGLWRIVFVLIPFFFLTTTASWYVTLMYLIPIFPLLYAMYKLAFDDKAHELYCLIKRAGLQKYDQAVAEYKKTEKFLQLTPEERSLRSFTLFLHRPR